ncbi:hypothetical protein PO909_029784 [Leuciscus waleckii]
MKGLPKGVALNWRVKKVCLLKKSVTLRTACTHPKPLMKTPNILCLKTVFLNCLRPVQYVQETAIFSLVAMGLFWPLINFARIVSTSDSGRANPVVGSTPVGNLLLSASLYFSGASFFQMKKVFESMHLKMFKYRTFRRHASMYLEPLIIYKWKKEQVDLVKDLCEADKVIIGGDMRADSPGHSAKYGSYTTMDLQKNLIIDIQLVQSNEVGGSYHMEKEGLKRSLEWLEECGVRLDCIVTDRHPQIQKLLKERNVTQYYDVWHLEKGLSKKLEQIARDKDCSIVKKWQHSIRTHLYWTAASSTSGPEKVAKWKSLINHIQDVHIHDDPLYPQCEHSHRVSKGSSKHFKPGSKPLYRVEKVLTNNKVLKDVAKLSPQKKVCKSKSSTRDTKGEKKGEKDVREL